MGLVKSSALFYSMMNCEEWALSNLPSCSGLTSDKRATCRSLIIYINFFFSLTLSKLSCLLLDLTKLNRFAHLIGIGSH